MNNKLRKMLIDLDGTVYNKHNGMWEEMTARIERYMRDIVGLSPDVATLLCSEYYKKYGSVLRGLKTHHQVDIEEYLAYIHDINLEKYLCPDPQLIDSLKALPYPKWIFTNADQPHARRVMKILGIEDLFEGIIDVWSMSLISKPDPGVYHKALCLIGSSDPYECMFVDDTLKNLKPAHMMGMTTVWIDSCEPQPYASFSIPFLHDLPYLMEWVNAASWWANFTSLGSLPVQAGLRVKG